MQRISYALFGISQSHRLDIGLYMALGLACVDRDIADLHDSGPKSAGERVM